MAKNKLIPKGEKVKMESMGTRRGPGTKNIQSGARISSNGMGQMASVAMKKMGVFKGSRKRMNSM